jgi:hypothetical protein
MDRDINEQEEEMLRLMIAGEGEDITSQFLNDSGEGDIERRDGSGEGMEGEDDGSGVGILTTKSGEVDKLSRC